MVVLNDASGDGSCGPTSTSNFSTCHTLFQASYDSTIPGSGNIGQALWVGTLYDQLWCGASNRDATRVRCAGTTKEDNGNLVSNMYIGGEIRLETAVHIPANRVIAISFEVINSDFGQLPPTVWIQHSNVSVASNKQEMTSKFFCQWVHDNEQLGRCTQQESPLDVLRIAGFFYATAQESEDSGGLINTLKFCFYNYAFLLPSLNTKLTISGLVGFQSTLKLQPDEPDNSRILKYAEAPLNVTGRATTEDWTGFVNVAEYNMSAGLIVVLTAATETVLPRFYCFTVEVKNPLETSPGVPVKVTTSSVNSMSFLMATPAGELPVGKILGWNLKKMGQSSTFPGALNTLTVTISLSGVIRADRKTSVHISNMTGAQNASATAASGDFRVRGLDNASSATFRSEADWDRSTGYLVIWLAQSIAGDTNYTLAFSLRNPSAGQDAPTVNIEIRQKSEPFVLISKMPFEEETKNKKPLLVARYIFTPRIVQSFSTASNTDLGFQDQLNTITFSFATNIWISPACKFTIKGLPQSIEGSGTFTGAQSTSSVKLDPRASNTDNAYLGYLLKATLEQASSPEWRAITAYAGWNKLTALNPPLPFLPEPFRDSYSLYAVSSKTVPLGGSTAYLGSFASYDSLQGELKGEFVQETVPYLIYSASFIVKNPPEGRAFGSPIEISLCGWPFTTMEPGKGNTAPGVVSGHIYPPFIFQDNPGVSATNRITIQLNLFAALGAGEQVNQYGGQEGDVIIVYGLNMANLRDTILTVDDASVEFPFACPIKAGRMKQR